MALTIHIFSSEMVPAPRSYIARVKASQLPSPEGSPLRPSIIAHAPHLGQSGEKHPQDLNSEPTDSYENCWH